MSDCQLQDTTLAKLKQLFPNEIRAAAIALLETNCGTNLPLIEAQGIAGIERVRCAAIKLSGGSLESLAAVVEQANRDWRDVLVGAGFANDAAAHLHWLTDS